eukprot:gene20867-7753_t
MWMVMLATMGTCQWVFVFWVMHVCALTAFAPAFYYTQEGFLSLSTRDIRWPTYVNCNIKYKPTRA